MRTFFLSVLSEKDSVKKDKREQIYLIKDIKYI